MTRPLLMGILNLTPDSFSGDGCVDAGGAMERYAQLCHDGADWVDVGAESTRPGAQPLSAEQEWARLEPFLVAWARGAQRVPLSLDSYHAPNIGKALALGVRMANDVSGLRDETMRTTLAAARCDVVVMHALGVPADRAVTLPDGTDPVAAILAWKQEITAQAQRAGIDPARLIYDPGIGFGKTAAQSLMLLEGAHTLVKSGGRWLVGHSRKSFMGEVDRDAETLRWSRKLADAGVHILRVHDVAAHREMFDA